MSLRMVIRLVWDCLNCGNGSDSIIKIGINCRWIGNGSPSHPDHHLALRLPFYRPLIRVTALPLPRPDIRPISIWCLHLASSRNYCPPVRRKTGCPISTHWLQAITSPMGCCWQVRQIQLALWCAMASLKPFAVGVISMVFVWSWMKFIMAWPLANEPRARLPIPTMPSSSIPFRNISAWLVGVLVGWCFQKIWCQPPKC